MFQNVEIIILKRNKNILIYLLKISVVYKKPFPLSNMVKISISMYTDNYSKFTLTYNVVGGFVHS